MPIKDYSTSAGSNTALFPEGMNPSSVNDSARQVQADIRSYYESPEFRDFGYAPTYLSATSFSVPSDTTAVFTVGRRLLLNSPLTSVYASVVSSSFASGSTTVTVALDSGTIDNTLNGVFLGYSTVGKSIPAEALNFAATHGQCRLVKSGTNLLLQPFGGNRLVINGVPKAIPANLTLAPTGLTAGTAYYIYAYLNAGVMALEASTTGHSTDTNGIETKTGDATRTLVGMARPITGSAWQDTAQQRFVISYFNRRTINTSSAFTGPRSTNSTVFVELNNEIRNEFLTWGDEIVEMSINGGFANSGSFYSQAAIGFGGAAVEPDIAFAFGTAFSAAVTMVRKSIAEGYSYSLFAGRSSNTAGTVTFGTSDIGSFSRMNGTIRG